MLVSASLIFLDLLPESTAEAEAEASVAWPLLVDLKLENRVVMDWNILMNGPFKHGMHAAQMAMYSSEKDQTRSGARSHVGSFVAAHSVMPTSLMMPLMEASIPSPIMKVRTIFSKSEHLIWMMKVIGRSENKRSLTMKTTRLVRLLFDSH
jgi:hypothetical protein